MSDLGQLPLSQDTADSKLLDIAYLVVPSSSPPAVMFAMVAFIVLLLTVGIWSRPAYTAGGCATAVSYRCRADELKLSVAALYRS